MKEFFVNLIISTPEYRGVGFNSITALFAITALLTFFLQLPGLYDQAKKIWKNKSAIGVNTSTFIIFLTYFLVFFIYSYSLPSGAGLLNSVVLFIPQVFILIGVLKFNTFNGSHCLTALVAVTLVITAMLFPNFREKIFSLTSLITFCALWLQPLEILKSKTAKNISRQFARNFLIVTVVWTIYGVIIKDLYIAVASVAFASAYGAMLVLWYKFRKEAT